MDNTIKGSINTRLVFILAGMILFLPPLSLIPQLVKEPNMCGTVCPRLFLIIPKDKGVLAGMISNMQAMWFGVALVGTILVVTFFFGRLWCSHLCPIGGATELLSRAVPGWMKINFSWISAPAFRYAYFFIFVAGAAVGVGSIACKLCNFRVLPFLTGAPFEPGYAAYLGSSMGIAGLLTLGITGVFAKGGRGYCNLLCPVGALDGLAGSLSAKIGFTRKIKTDGDKCNGCGACVDACMVWARTVNVARKIEMDTLSCMACKECTKVCKEGAISYGRN